MSKHDCLNDQDLILYYYDDPSAGDDQLHLSNCSLCRHRLDALARDLRQLPTPICEPDDLVGVRMAARVAGQIQQPRKRFLLPAVGATAAAALVLMITFSGSPPPEITRVVKQQPPPKTLIEPFEGMPDVELLEDIEVLQELELLAQLEGV